MTGTRGMAILVTVLGAGALSQSLAFGSDRAGACASGKVAKTSSYVLALSIGRSEAMYMPSEVKARHPKTGEVMLGGEMAMVDNPPAGTKVYHLEVHICTKSGAVATKLKPDIAVAGSSMSMNMGGMTTHLPVAIMQGVAAGPSDYHYGNEVALKPGAKVTVTVTVKAQRAVFHATVPRLA